jgi:hypothetical protein
MVTFGDQQNEPTVKADVLGIGNSPFLAVGSFPGTRLDAVLLNQFPIYF